MEAIITKSGLLLIKRKEDMKLTSCPVTSHKELNCGDWCPKFREPVKIFYDDISKDTMDSATNTDNPPKAEKIVIKICDGDVLIFDKFTDERI